MRPILFSLAVACAASLPSPTRAAENPCEQFLAAGGKPVIQRMATSEIRVVPNGCVMTDGSVPASSMASWQFERAEIRGDGLLEGISSMKGAIPSWGRLSVEGLRYGVSSDNKLINYISSLPQQPTDLSASYRWFPQEGRLTIEEWRISKFPTGEISLSADLTLPKDASVEKLDGIAGLSISSLRIRMNSRGMFEQFFVLALGAIMARTSSGEDPEQAVQQWRQGATALLRGLPEERLEPLSRKALIRFVEDMPHPAGRFSMEVHFQKPLPLGKLDPDSPASFFESLTENATILARYTPY